jgi:hypothetical protein
MVKNARLRSRTGDSRRRGPHCAYRSLGAAARARRSSGDDLEGAAKRLRPKFMTVATMFVGLIPIMWATGRVGRVEANRIFTSFVRELVVYPAIYEIWKWHFEMKRTRAEAQPAALVAVARGSAVSIDAFRVSAHAQQREIDRVTLLRDADTLVQADAPGTDAAGTCLRCAPLISAYIRFLGAAVRERLPLADGSSQQQSSAKAASCIVQVRRRSDSTNTIVGR